MEAQEFMQGHADKACAGKIPEIMGDLTPEAMAQLMPLVAGGPNPVKTNNVTAVRADGNEPVFDVTYAGDGGATITLRETLRQMDGVWKIVKLEKP